MKAGESKKLLSKVNIDGVLSFLEILNKFVPVIITAIITWYANSFESKLAITNLISQREQAESQLRANMFNTLIGPLFGTEKDRGRDPNMPEHELILVELLALNFGEHFEIKPLLKHVENTLENSKRNPDEKNKSLKDLWSISKRVADRQLASLQQQGNKKDFTRVEEVTFIETLKSDGELADYSSLKSQNHKVIVKNYSSNRNIEVDYDYYTESADQKSNARISLNKANWDNNSFIFDVNVQTEVLSKRAKIQDFKFEVSWFDLPLVDNILLSDGNRISLLLEKVDLDSRQEKKLKYATVKVVWFPKAFFTPRERPIDFGIVREKLEAKN